MSNQQMVTLLNEMLHPEKGLNLPWKYRVVLAWCIAKLLNGAER